MEDWDDLRFVHALSRAGTMKAAAELTGANAATVSRRIERLTRQIGTQLFTKEAEGWSPTREGAALAELAARIQAELEEFETTLSQPDRELSGAIAISCYRAIYSVALVPNIERFHRRYPNLTLDIEYRPNRSLARGDIDLALRLERPAEGRLIARQVGMRVSAFFIRKGCGPGSDWIGLAREFDDLPMMTQGAAFFGKPPSIRLGSLSEIENAILSTNLPGPLLTCVARGRADLEQLPGSALVSTRPVYLIYHESRRNDVRLQTVKAWVESCFSGPQSCPCGKCGVDTGGDAG